MAERVGDPVPRKIRDQLERGEKVLVYELVTRPRDPGLGDDGTWAARFAPAIGTDDQHELLLTQQRLAVVSTRRRDKEPSISTSVSLDQLVAVEAVGSGLERGRIRFEFRDGSEARGVMGLVLARPARRFLAAYDSTRRRPPGGRR